MREKKTNECDICGKVLDEEYNSKAMLIHFMRARNLMNVNIATKDLMKNKTSKAILNQFMRGKTL